MALTRSRKLDTIANEACYNPGIEGKGTWRVAVRLTSHTKHFVDYFRQVFEILKFTGVSLGRRREKEERFISEKIKNKLLSPQLQKDFTQTHFHSLQLITNLNWPFNWLTDVEQKRFLGFCGGI